MLGGDRRGGAGPGGRQLDAGLRLRPCSRTALHRGSGLGPGGTSRLRALLASRLAGLAPCRQPFSPELSPPAPRRPRKTFLLFSSFSLSCLHLSQLFLPYSVILFPSFFSFLVLNFFFIVAKYVT